MAKFSTNILTSANMSGIRMPLLAKKGSAILSVTAVGDDSASGDFYLFNPVQIYMLGSDRYSWQWQEMSYNPRKIKIIDAGYFLEQFLFIESLTLHLICLSNASSLHQYIDHQRIIAKIPLSDRIKETAILASRSSEPKNSEVSKLGDLLELRNQIGHNLKPSFVKYGKQRHFYANNDTEKIEEIVSIMTKGMSPLCERYIDESCKLYDWITVPITSMLTTDKSN